MLILFFLLKFSFSLSTPSFLKNHEIFLSFCFQKDDTLSLPLFKELTALQNRLDFSYKKTVPFMRVSDHYIPVEDQVYVYNVSQLGRRSVILSIHTILLLAEGSLTDETYRILYDWFSIIFSKIFRLESLELFHRTEKDLKNLSFFEREQKVLVWINFVKSLYDPRLQSKETAFSRRYHKKLMENLSEAQQQTLSLDPTWLKCWHNYIQWYLKKRSFLRDMSDRIGFLNPFERRDSHLSHFSPSKTILDMQVVFDLLKKLSCDSSYQHIRHLSFFDPLYILSGHRQNQRLVDNIKRVACNYQKEISFFISSMRGAFLDKNSLLRLPHLMEVTWIAYALGQIDYDTYQTWTYIASFLPFVRLANDQRVPRYSLVEAYHSKGLTLFEHELRVRVLNEDFLLPLDVSHLDSETTLMNFFDDRYSPGCVGVLMSASQKLLEKEKILVLKEKLKDEIRQCAVSSLFKLNLILPEDEEEERLYNTIAVSGVGRYQILNPGVEILSQDPPLLFLKFILYSPIIYDLIGRVLNPDQHLRGVLLTTSYAPISVIELLVRKRLRPLQISRKYIPCVRYVHSGIISSFLLTVHDLAHIIVLFDRYSYRFTAYLACNYYLKIILEKNFSSEYLNQEVSIFGKKTFSPSFLERFPGETSNIGKKMSRLWILDRMSEQAIDPQFSFLSNYVLNMEAYLLADFVNEKLFVREFKVEYDYFVTLLTFEKQTEDILEKRRLYLDMRASQYALLELEEEKEEDSLMDVGRKLQKKDHLDRLSGLRVLNLGFSDDDMEMDIQSDSAFCYSGQKNIVSDLVFIGKKRDVHQSSFSIQYGNIFQYA